MKNSAKRPPHDVRIMPHNVSLEFLEDKHSEARIRVWYKLILNSRREKLFHDVRRVNSKSINTLDAYGFERLAGENKDSRSCFSEEKKAET